MAGLEGHIGKLTRRATLTQCTRADTDWLSPAVSLPVVHSPSSIGGATATLKHFAEMLRAADGDGGKHHSLLLRLKSILFLMASHQRIIAPLRKKKNGWEVLTENYRAGKKKQKTKTQQLICGWIKSEMWLRWLLVVSTFCSSSRQCFHFVKHMTPSFIPVQAPTTFIQDKQLTRQDLYVCRHWRCVWQPAKLSSLSDYWNTVRFVWFLWWSALTRPSLVISSRWDIGSRITLLSSETQCCAQCPFVLCILEHRSKMACFTSTPLIYQLTLINEVQYAGDIRNITLSKCKYYSCVFMLVP